MSTWHGVGGADYHSAAVCRRGHVEAGAIELRRGAPPACCARCGATVLTACGCGAPIRGLMVGIAALFTPSPFCVECGAPFPWASNEEVAFHVENLLDSEPDLDDGDRRVLRTQLATLRHVPSDSGIAEKQVAVLTRFKQMAPKAWALAVPALQSIITAEMKAKLGLPLN